MLSLPVLWQNLKTIFYREISPILDIRRMQVHIVEAGDRLLAGMSQKSSEKSLRFLRKIGINIHLNTFVNDYDGDTVKTSNLELKSKTLDLGSRSKRSSG